MSKTRVCHWCEAVVPADSFCPACLAAFPQRPDPAHMTPDERGRELLALGWLEVPFDLIHGRIEALVGRPVWTHELGMVGLSGLVGEARGERPHATFTEILDRWPGPKVIVAVVDEERG